ncbi:MAG TPA: hypothetical protein VJR94_10920 [Candidatus Nitrosocosmicus sp.]|jgi:hypothetical protein|nr:hypothetical protein [Candidatus Nitrosocosmicus sp.]
MDFVNQHIQRMNRERRINSNPLNQFPKKELSELEQLNDQMIESIKVRMQNLPEGNNHYQSFRKMVDQTRGHDTSNLSNLTKEFLESRRKNFS